MTELTVFDGAGSIGGNKLHLRCGKNRGVLLDFGINYKRMSLFYEEYLRPRAARGLYDYLEVGLAPRLRIYRPDIITPDLGAETLRGCPVDAVFLTHAHMDHAGCVGLLDPNIPVVCTPHTAAILKAVQDAGRTELHNQIAYLIPREPLSDDARVLKSSPWRTAPAVGRKFLLAGKPSAELQEFWEKPAGARGLQTEPLETVDFDHWHFRCWEVDHSVYGSAAFGFETENGWVVYTGDLRMGGKRRSGTVRFAREASELGVRALIIEGTRAGSGPADSGSEAEVLRNSLEAVEKESGLVIADFQPRHVERLETFLKIADECGRSLVITARDAYLLEAMKAVDGVDRMRGCLVYRELKDVKNLWERSLLERLGERVVDPSDVARNPDAYILSFSFWDMKNLLDIKPNGGTYIYSASEAFTEEAEFDFLRLWEWLRLFDFKVLGFEVRVQAGQLKPVFKRGYHASGHASESELLEIIEIIGPEIVIPVHTENPHFFAERVRASKVVIPKNGRSLDLSKLK